MIPRRFFTTRPRVPGITTGVAVGLACLLGLGGDAASAATLRLVGPDGVEVLLDDRPLGRLPLSAPLELPAGSYTVRCDVRGYRPYRATVILAEDSQVRLRVRLTPLSRNTAVLSSLVLAGQGQRYVGRPTSGWILTGLEVGGLVTAIYAQSAYSNHRKDYLLLYEEYQKAVILPDIERLRTAAETSYRDMEDAESLRDTALLVAVGAVAVSMLDAWLRFPSAEIGVGPVPVQTIGSASAAAGGFLAGAGQGDPTVHAAWRIGF